LAAYLYHGRSGWGWYFQLRMKDKPDFIYDGGFEKKEIGGTIQVVFEGDIHSPRFILKDASEKTSASPNSLRIHRC
jgi:hypothetical protein